MLGPASYIAAHRTDPGINAFASLSRKPGIFQEDGAFYRSLLVVSAHSAKRSVEALRGASLAVVDPNSTSGMIIPRHYLAQEFKVKLNDHFGRVVYTGNHPRSAMLVHDGHVDAAFVSSYQLSEVVAAGKAKAEDFLVLWKSPRIPHGSVRDAKQTLPAVANGYSQAIPERSPIGQQGCAGVFSCRALLSHLRS